MDKKNETIFLESAINFLDSLDHKAREKIIYNIEKAENLRQEYFDSK